MYGFDGWPMADHPYGTLNMNDYFELILYYTAFYPIVKATKMKAGLSRFLLYAFGMVWMFLTVIPSAAIALLVAGISEMWGLNEQKPYDY